MLYCRIEPMEDLTEYLSLSPDHNKERLKALKDLFPDLFTSEGQLNADELKKIVDPKSVNETERYEFRWFGKSQAKRNAFTPSNATLVYDEKRSVNPDKSENLIIEGENLEVLKLLSSAYREKIKCIYIDPPYNTGKDFVYSDNFTQDKKGYWEDAGVVEQGVKIDTNTEADGRYHSNWLNMMYSRLLIARQLLKSDGVIFISIDDNEVHNLTKLCDEVFGEENFIATLPVVMNLKGNPDNFGFSDTHEYVLVYAKVKDECALYQFDIDEDGLDDWSEDEYGLYKKADTLRRTGQDASRAKRPKGWFPIFITPDDSVYVTENDQPLSEEDIVLYPINDDGEELSWTWGKQKITYEPHNLIVTNGRSGKNIYKKQRPQLGDIPSKKPKTLFYKPEYSTSTATTELKNLLGKKMFEGPKPVPFLMDLITIGSKENDIVLDFFAGSGTTGQAIFELNHKQGKNRRFILVQLPEKTDQDEQEKISDITIKRNRHVVERIIRNGQSKTLDIFKSEEGSNGLGFKVFKLTKSKFPRVEWTPEPDKSEVENIDALKKYISEKEAQLVTLFNREELTTEILLKKGFNLNYTTTKQNSFEENEVYLAIDGNKQALICLDAPLMDGTVEYLKNNTDKVFICLERALDTTKKWNLKHYLGDKLQAF